MPSSTDGKMTLYAALGVMLSSYAIYVEHKMTHKPPEEDFSALCDIEALGASCSSVFQLPVGRMLSYFGIVPAGHMLDLPNAAIGLVYYSLWLTSVMPSLPKSLRLLIASLAMASSVFLAVQLLILSELCILCWSTHIINARLWWNAYMAWCGTGGRVKDVSSGETRGKAKIKRV